MRFRLRSLLIVLALAPPLIAGGYWGYWPLLLASAIVGVIAAAVLFSMSAILSDD